MAEHLKKKAAKSILKSIKCKVTRDPNDNSNVLIDSSELIGLLKKKIKHAAVYECPLESLTDVLQAMGIVHQGIVVTTETGKKYVVHKLPSGNNNGKGDAVVSEAEKLGRDWNLVREKEVRSAKLEDYLERCGDNYDTIADNCLHAVARMWSLQ